MQDYSGAPKILVPRSWAPQDRALIRPCIVRITYKILFGTLKVLSMNFDKRQKHFLTFYTWNLITQFSTRLNKTSWLKLLLLWD